MKAHSLKYLIKEGFRNLWVNRLMSVASVGVLMSCLILIGSAVMVFMNINVLLNKVEEQNVVMIYVNEETSAAEITAMKSKIQNVSNIKDVTYISKETAWADQLKEMDKATQEFFKSVGREIPLLNSYKVTLEDMSQFDSTIQELQELDHVENVRENRDLANKLTGIRHAVTIISIAIIGILFAVSLFIISNTIKLTMYSRRLEINIMKSVGATNGFVRFPFIIEGMILGVLSGLISLLLVFGIYKLAAHQLTNIVAMFDPVPFAKVLWPMLGVFLLIGILCGVGGSIISMNKYLKKEGSEISEI